MVGVTNHLPLLVDNCVIHLSSHGTHGNGGDGVFSMGGDGVGVGALYGYGCGNAGCLDGNGDAYGAD